MTRSDPAFVDVAKLAAIHDNISPVRMRGALQRTGVKVFRISRGLYQVRRVDYQNWLAARVDLTPEQLSCFHAHVLDEVDKARRVVGQ